jgi:glyoxylase-like metal-dependent hydrolase (beta-lactamase superfamily II)
LRSLTTSLAALGALLLLASAALAADAPPWRQPLSGLTLTILDTGRVNMPDAYAWKGGGKTKRPWPILAFLIRHPEGTLLIDSGCNPALGRGREREYAGWFYPIAKLIFDFPTMAPDQDVASQLGRLGVEPGSLESVILTHAHVDHIGGVATIPTSVPVYVGEGELQEFEHWDADLKGFHPKDRETGHHFPTVSWQDRPVLGFDRSWDIFEDGSVVAIEAPGHTTGSLMVLVNLESRPVLITGDAAYTHRNYEIPAPKGKLFLHDADWDESWAMDVIARLRNVHLNHPEVLLLLSHDWEQFPSLKIAPETYR